MAKKKEEIQSDNPKDYGLDKMTLIELEEALEFSKKEENEHMVGLLNGQIKFKKRMEKKKAEISKNFAKMAAITDKIDFKQVAMKPQEWINMSSAFKETLRQPGIPIGHASMVYGHSDVGKTTMAVELATFAQKQGIFPILIITENKFSIERAEIMGLITEKNYCHIHNDVDTIEEGCDIVDNYIKLQEAGDFPMDIVFIWDSIGQAQSNAERAAIEAGKGSGGMMSTARVIHQRIKRHICKKINSSRREDYPYTNSIFFVNHAYTKPPTPPATMSSLAPYGGEGIWLASTFVVQMGGVTSRSSKVEATKDGVKVSFAIRSSIKLAKNHVNNVSARGKILCTDHGFIMDDKKAIDEYKASTREDWSLEFDNDWDQVGTD
jgi:hypothetical protein